LSFSKSNFLEKLEIIDFRILKLAMSCMFYKTLRGARIAGYVQSLIYSAAQNDINPYNYLKAILCHPKEVILNPDKWLPWNYQSNLDPTNGCHEASKLTA